LRVVSGVTLPRALGPYKVLDLSWHAAGPLATKLLADFGAEVIKVERPGVGDPTRSWGPFPDDPDPEKSAPFLFLNTNKLGVTANLKHPAGRDLVLALAADADVVVESFRPGVLDGLGLGYDQLRKVNPDVILVSVSSFGQTGPFRDLRGTELTLWGMGEVPYITGSNDGPPIKTFGYQASYHAGANALTGALAALWARASTGEGRYIDVSVLEAVVNLIEFSLGLYECLGIVGRRRFGARTGFYPSGPQQAADGELMMMFGSRRGRDVAVVLDLPGLADPKFDTNMGRWQHREEFDEIFLPWLRRQSVDDVVMRLQLEARIPLAKIMKLDQLLDDPQFRAREFFLDIEQPDAGVLAHPGPPYKLTATPASYRRPAPRLGEHNTRVYGALGKTQADLTRLHEEGVI
jgi:crotonobetainyl-CoA:carnitine CoA-transferase CaiB-like acyl-CoA transferase